MSSDILTSHLDRPESSYQYKSLDTSTPTIRLCRLLPRKPNGDLCILLDAVHLDEVDKQYVAISYTWGPELPTYRVWIGEQYIMLRKNIWDFLNAFYSFSESHRRTRWWIDSVCIDQKDDGADGEKGLQIQMMGQIYSKAVLVMIWLGADDVFGGKVFPMPRKSRQWEYLSGHDQFNAEFSRIVDTFDELLCEDEGLAKCEALRKAVRDIFSHPYWERLWIVQEIYFGKIVNLFWGGELLPFDWLFSVYKVLRDGHTPLLTGESDNIVRKRFSCDDFLCDSPSMLRQQILALVAETPHDPIFEVRYESKSGKEDLNELLKRCCTKKCKDPRDKIYGLIGMTEDAHKFQIDYSCEVKELGKKTLQYLQRKENAKLRGLPQYVKLDFDPSFLRTALRLTIDDLPDVSYPPADADDASNSDNGSEDSNLTHSDGSLGGLRERELRKPGVDVEELNINCLDIDYYNFAIKHARIGDLDSALLRVNFAWEMAEKRSGADSEMAIKCEDLRQKILEHQVIRLTQACRKLYEVAASFAAKDHFIVALLVFKKILVQLHDDVELSQLSEAAHETTENCKELRTTIIEATKGPLAKLSMLQDRSEAYADTAGRLFHDAICFMNDGKFQTAIKYLSLSSAALRKANSCSEGHEAILEAQAKARELLKESKQEFNREVSRHAEDRIVEVAQLSEDESEESKSSFEKVELLAQDVQATPTGPWIARAHMPFREKK